MTRHELATEGSIEVAYGLDHATGYFLSVTDKRLVYDSNASAEVNAVTEKIGVKDGGGSYFDLHTGSHRFGIKVSTAVLAEFMKRYGVPAEHYEKVKKNLPI